MYLRPAFAAGRARLLLRERGRARRGGWGSAAPQRPSLFQSFYISLTSAGITGPAALAGEPQHVRHAHISALPACSQKPGRAPVEAGAHAHARGAAAEGLRLGGLRRWTLPLPGRARSVAIKTMGSQRERGPDFRGGASQAGDVQERSAFYGKWEGFASVRVPIMLRPGSWRLGGFLYRQVVGSWSQGGKRNSDMVRTHAKGGAG